MTTSRSVLLSLVLLLACTWGGSALVAEDHIVLVKPDNTFEPAILSIALGDSVTWINEGGLHNVNAPGLFRCANGCDGDGMGGDGSPATNDWTATVTFDEEGTVNYVCDVHISVGMIGTILVGESAGVDVRIDGSCPGPGQVNFSVAGALSGADVAIMTSESLGASTVPGNGPCAGTPLELESPELLRVETTDLLGRLTRSADLPNDDLCGLFVQVMDIETCDTSGTAQMPIASADLMGLEPINAGEGDITMREVVDFRHANDGTGWVYIGEQPGRIRIYDGVEILDTPFLNIVPRVNSNGTSQGFYGAAFPDDYSESGEFYVYYTDLNGDSVLSRFLRSEDDPMLADVDSEEQLFFLEQPDPIHQGGPPFFGPDGYLYLPLGDGGPIGDPMKRAQDLQQFYGKVLRLDVEGGTPYAIPPDNPFVGNPDALDEIWAYGLRNPWRISFDSVTGDLYITDVGNADWEEINVQMASSPGGENYGWSLMEGPDCFDPPIDCNDGTLTLPTVSYPHFDETGFVGCSITGGAVYHGPDAPSLEGRFIYGDFCTGQIWGASRVPGGSWLVQEMYKTALTVRAFGEGEDGTLYVGHNQGVLYKVVENPFAE